MKEKIVQKATQMFLSLGFKSVTMDDIASDMGISKKTIYQSFSNKNCLVKECVLGLFDTISSGVDKIVQEKKNPIEELFEIKNFIAKHLKDEQSSPMCQLQKYFPKIHESLHQKQLSKLEECIKVNLHRGVEIGLFRKEIPVDFIGRIYFVGIQGIRDKTIFPEEQYTNNDLIEQHLEYHLRAICTVQGLEIMKELQNKNT
ncbi:MAG: TetR/AcrR family transcriptional regulator [Flavobacteriales bacterium]|nr:TetR/AcrR family transcriptional regulator [Flavobacteriales bacterium]